MHAQALVSSRGRHRPDIEGGSTVARTCPVYSLRGNGMCGIHGDGRLLRMSKDQQYVARGGLCGAHEGTGGMELTCPRLPAVQLAFALMTACLLAVSAGP